MEMTIEKISQLQPDEVLTLLGTFSRYQQIIYFLLGLVVFRGVFPVIGIILIGKDPGHFCDTTFYNDSLTTNFSPEEPSQCYIHTIQKGKNVTIPCPGKWEYNTTFTSIVTQWDLVCSRAYLVDLSSTFYMVGCAFGCIFVVPLGDKFGRRCVLFISLACLIILSISLAFSNTIILFIVLRFFIGILNMAATLNVYCMIAEFLPSTHRTLPVIGASFFWSSGIMVLALIGYFIKDWRILQIVISLPNLVILLLWWFLPESITWLFLKGNYQETLNIIQSANKWNKKKIGADVFSNFHDQIQVSSQNPDGLDSFLTSGHNNHHDPSMTCNPLEVNTANEVNMLKDDNKIPYLYQKENGLQVSNSEDVQAFQSTSYLTGSTNYQNSSQRPEALPTDLSSTVSFCSLFTTPKMLLYTLITYYLLMIVSLSYFGILLKAPTLHGNVYMNLFFSAVVEIGANIVVMFIINRIGRRKPISCFLLICGISNLISLGIFYSEIQNKTVLMLIWTMIARFGISGSYSMIYLLLPEIFPTAVRNRAMGSASLFENLGSILAPLVMLLDSDVVPLSVFGVLTVIGGLLVLLLPETHLKPLPNSVGQVESW